MTAKKLAAILNGREMGNEITPDEEAAANTAGLVVAFGHSDDCVEFRGAINGTVFCYFDRDIYITALGILDKCDCGNETCLCYTLAKKFAKKIKTMWDDRGGPCWTYETDIPHETFEIYKDRELFCIGIVFSVKDLTQKTEKTDL